MAVNRCETNRIMHRVCGYVCVILLAVVVLTQGCVGAPSDLLAASSAPCSLATRSNARDLLQSNTTAAQADQIPTTAPSEKAKSTPHKQLIPLHAGDIGMLVVAGVVLFICAGAGMGGGPVLVPAYLTLGAFSQSTAVALSNSTILAGSIANVLCNARKRHPFKDKPLVDWDLILLMEPPTLLGAIAGSYINKLLPAWISHLLLALLLTLMTVRVLQRASMIYRRETATRSSAEAPPTAAPAGRTAAAAGPKGNTSSPCSSSASRLPSSAASAGLHQQQQQQQSSNGCCQQAAAAKGSQQEGVCSAGGASTGGGAADSSNSNRMSFGGGDAVVQLVAVVHRPAAAPGASSSSSEGRANGTSSSSAVPRAAAQCQQEQQDTDGRVCPFPGAPVRASPFAAQPVQAADAAAAAAGAGAASRSEHVPPSHVPSSVMLSIELEGNIISEQVLAQLAQQAGRTSGASSSTSPQATVQTAANTQQQQQQHQQQQQRGDSASLPPSESECRLAYAPPSHTRRSSWELQGDWDRAWEEAEEEELLEEAGEEGTGAAGAGHGSSSSSAGQPAASGATRPVQADSAGAGAGCVCECDAASSSSYTSHASFLHGERGTLSTAANSAARLNVTGMLSRKLSSQSSHGRSFVEKQQQEQQQQQPPELAAQSERVQAMLAAESRQLPLVPVALLVTLFVAVLLTSLFSKAAGCGSVAYWLVQWSVAPVLFGVWCYSRKRVLRKVVLKRAAQYDFHGDVRWTSRNSIVFPAICSLAGVIAGMFGLGGAVVKTPLMLELGVQPQVTAATTQTMLLLTTAASTIVYAQMGDIAYDYAAVLLPMAFVATLAGQFAIDALVKKLGRSSLVVIVLAAFFVVACGCTYYVAAVSLKAVVADPAGATVPGRICGA